MTSSTGCSTSSTGAWIVLRISSIGLSRTRHTHTRMQSARAAITCVISTRLVGYSGSSWAARCATQKQSAASSSLRRSTSRPCPGHEQNAEYHRVAPNAMQAVLPSAIHAQQPVRCGTTVLWLVLDVPAPRLLWLHRRTEPVLQAPYERVVIVAPKNMATRPPPPLPAPRPWVFTKSTKYPRHLTGEIRMSRMEILRDIAPILARRSGICGIVSQ